MDKQLHRNHHGFTLIEIMVAMLIGLFLMGGVLQLFSGMNTSARLQQQMGYLQENGRLAIELLSKDIRNADYWGCAANVNVGSVIDPEGDGYNKAIHGAQAQNGLSGTDGADGAAGEQDAPDTITLRGTSGMGDIVIESHQIQAATIQASGADVNNLKLGQIVMISNCSSADMFQITNDPSKSGQQVNHGTGGNVKPGNAATYSQGEGNCTNCFQTSYEDTGALLLVPYSTTFAILDSPASGLPALFMTNTGNCPTGCELIEGVENMQIQYGEDTTDDRSVNRYVDADEAGLDMNNVIAVKISLLVRTEQTIAGSGQTLSYNDSDVTPR